VTPLYTVLARRPHAAGESPIVVSRRAVHREARFGLLGMQILILDLGDELAARDLYPGLQARSRNGPGNESSPAAAM
jgi:hypothetical protein